MHDFLKLFKPVKFGLVLAIGAILYGFVMGGVFGANEGAIKDLLNSQAQPVFASVYNSDAAKMTAVLNKSFNYMVRSHLHGGGIGTAALVLIIVLGLMNIKAIIKTFVSLGLGLGSLGYSVFWMIAGVKAPALGSTGAAKEALSWLAIPSAGLLLLGTISVLLLVIYQLFLQREDKTVTSPPEPALR